MASLNAYFAHHENKCLQAREKAIKISNMWLIATGIDI